MRFFPSILLAALLVPILAEASGILRDVDGTAGLRLGAAAGGLDDQDGDGRWELLVGAPGSDTSGADAGRVCLWFGADAMGVAPDRVWHGSNGERFGQAVARIGDVNDDGIGDFAVGAPYSDAVSADGGRVYVFFGGAPLPSSPDLILESPSTGGRFGWSVAALGDLDGDDVDDFAVGAPWDDSAGLEAGAAFVYLGGRGGPSDEPDRAYRGVLAYDRFGWSVAGAAEFLGGQARCLAVGAPSNGPGAGDRHGSVLIFAGSTSSWPGPDTDVDLVLRSSSSVIAGDAFGYSIDGIGRFDGDGDPDLAVGIPFCDEGGLERGRVEVFLGGYDADGDGDAACSGPSSGARLGWSVAGVGDVVGTGHDDVLIGAPYDDTVAAEAGRAFLWAGGATGSTSAASLPAVPRTGLVDAPAGDHFGAWCAAAGDIDGDGASDYAVGAPEGNVGSAAVAGWVRFVDSGGQTVPVQIGAWACDWAPDGAAAGRLPLYGLGPADVRALRVQRLAGGARVDLDVTTCVVVEDGLLRLRDDDAAWQTRGSFAYRLVLDLDGGGEFALDLSGPDGARPAAAPDLLPPAPNPSNPATTVRWRAFAGTPVTVAVVDVRGRHVRDLHAGEATGQWQTARWGGRDGAGRALPAGVYLVQLRAGNQLRVQRVTLVE